jgi:hypothetical protein
MTGSKSPVPPSQSGTQADDSMSYGPGRYDPNYEERGHDYPLPYVRWTEKRNIESFLELVGDKRVNVERLTTHRFRIEDAETRHTN